MGPDHTFSYLADSILQQRERAAQRVHQKEQRMQYVLSVMQARFVQKSYSAAHVVEDSSPACL
jgi:hypothetical protein